MKPQYLVYDHNRFSAKMRYKFYYFSKKFSKTGKTDVLAAPRDLHPSHSCESPCHTGGSLYHCAGHGGGSFHSAACGTLIVSLALLGVLAYQPAGSPHIERVRLPYAAPCAFFVKVLGACQPAKAHHEDVLLRNGKKRRAVMPPVLSCPLFSCLLSHAKGHNLYNQLGIQSAPQLHV